MLALPALALLWPALATSPAAAQSRVWTGEDNGYSRQISIALAPDRVFLAEAYLVTTIDRASGAATTARIPSDDYTTVESAVFADGLLWLSIGNGTSSSAPRISTFDGTTFRERARPHAVACSLARSGRELFWVDRDGEHVHRLGPRGSAIVARAPRGRRFVVDCRIPLALDADHVYLVHAASGIAGPQPLISVARRGGAVTELDADVAGRLPIEIGGALALAYAHGSPASIELFDPRTRGRWPLVSQATLIAAAIDGDALVWIDGNYFGGDDWVVRRIEARAGATPAELHRGDRRLGTAIAADAAGTFALVQAHPPGECTTERVGCGHSGMEEITRCAAPDHQLFFLPR